MLIDLHAHSSGISKCCCATYEEAIRAAMEAGLDGIVLANHYYKAYVKDGDYSSFARRYTHEFRLAKEYGERVGARVFLGVEVTMERHGLAHMLIYGVDEEFIESNPTLFDLTISELYSLVKSAGGVLVQAHPYRGKPHLLDTSYMDGVEVNCHPLYGKSDFEQVSEVALQNKLLLTCGGDYHADTYRPTCGVYLPDGIENGVELGRYLLSAPSLTLCIHEPGTKKPYLFEWNNLMVL